MKENALLPLFLLRCPKFCSAAAPLQNFDRGHSSRSLFPPPAAVALVPPLPKRTLKRGLKRKFDKPNEAMAVLKTYSFGESFCPAFFKKREKVFC